MKITDDKTIHTALIIAGAFIVYTTGVFFAKDYYNKNPRAIQEEVVDRSKKG